MIRPHPLDSSICKRQVSTTVNSRTRATGELGGAEVHLITNEMASAGLATLVLSSSSEGAYSSSSTILQRKVESQPDSNADANYNDNIYRSSKRRDATTCNSRNRSVTLYCSLAHVLCGILLLIAKMHYLNASAVSGEYTSHSAYICVYRTGLWTCLGQFSKSVSTVDDRNGPT